MVQVTPAPSVGPQLLLTLNSGLSLDAMLAIASELVPVFFSETVSALAVTPTLVLGKVRLVGVSCTPGAFTPVPLNETLWVAPVEELSLMFSVPARGFAAVGVNVM